MLMNNYIHPLQQQALKKPVSTPSKKDTTVNDCKKPLHHASKCTVKVSKHAAERLTARNRQINDATWQLIDNTMQAANQRGTTHALVITDEAALVVSTKNNTFITALHQDEAKDKIFSNINGTILI